VSRHRSRRAVGLVAVMSALLLALVTATPALAATFWANVPAYPIASKCVGRDNYGNPTISWRGGDPVHTVFYPYNNEPHGKMYLCYYTYRLGTKTADGDYYAVDLKTVWQGQAFFTNHQATAIQYVESNRSSKDQIFDSTPTYTSNVSCTAPVSVGISAGYISVSTEFQVCSGTTVSAVGWSMGGDWSTNSALNVRTIETSFFQKVAHGLVPTFTIEFAVPYYTYQQVGTQEWSITRAWHWYDYSPTGTV
jgi:hypothetical protein